MLITATKLKRGRPVAAGSARGFSLIEVMISVVLGLILISSVLALVVSILGSNAETIRVTRLTQELRTLVEVVGREAERARLMTDPFSVVGSPVNPTNAANPGATNHNGLVDDSEAGCLKFSYAEPDGTSGTNNTAVTIDHRNGALFIGSVTDAVLQNWTDPDGNTRQRTTLVACDSATTRLSSPEIEVTGFVVSVLDGADLVDNTTDAAGADGWVDCDQPDSILSLTIQARLVSDTSVTRTVTDRIRIGSADLKTDPVCFIR